ncbi:MAG: AAA family ATPase, partial [Campylobacter sp.]|nr:AAA family ATPase [Campylobacter sp.]
MAKLKTLFECEACGNQQSKWMGKCPQCGAWESFIELSNEQIKASQELAKLTKTTKNATPISQIQIEQIKRKSTGDNELDLVLGGGVVSGSLVLIGGSPGIGKSTLLLKIASNLANDNQKVLYVSGEESASQIKLRADRLNANSDNLFLLTEIDLSSILAEVAKNEYKAIVIDSIQTLYSDKISSAPGSISQVREITLELMRLAKKDDIAIFIIGHITK